MLPCLLGLGAVPPTVAVAWESKSPGRSAIAGPMAAFGPSLLASFGSRGGAAVCGGLTFLGSLRAGALTTGFCRENARCGDITSHYRVINRLRSRSILSRRAQAHARYWAVLGAQNQAGDMGAFFLSVSFAFCWALEKKGTGSTAPWRLRACEMPSRQGSSSQGNQD